MNPDSIVSRLGRGWIFLALTVALLVPAIAYSADVVINEIMADNESAFAPFPDLDPDYFPDYVELYNNTTSDIDLNNETWTLSTKKDPNPADFRDHFHFPANSNSIIRADSYLLVFFDNKTNFPGIHTGFRLNGTNVDFTLKASGDEVLLFKF